jgi:hypothetical protein
LVKARKRSKTGKVLFLQSEKALKRAGLKVDFITTPAPVAQVVSQPKERPLQLMANSIITGACARNNKMRGSQAGASGLASRETAIVNGRLDRYTEHHSIPADIAA